MLGKEYCDAAVDDCATEWDTSCVVKQGQGWAKADDLLCARSFKLECGADKATRRGRAGTERDLRRRMTQGKRRPCRACDRRVIPSCYRGVYIVRLSLILQMSH